MTTIQRFAPLLVMAISSLSACQRTHDVAPVTVEGEWRLTVSGGGITGKMDAVPAGQDSRLMLGANQQYSRYYNGQLQESSTYEVRTVKHSYDSGEDKVLFFKSANSPNGQSYDRQEIITSLTDSRMELTTGGGCAINSVYERVSSGVTYCGVK
ncbi:hypothetical protein [Hymenobacter properus]|uniref:Lipocalin-like domain-containing protein n=1 Tax=Hymenobacter properus TaxID=2791026 RepID=A0A931FJS6_9BACT|nr:hypothetical protein [Hymenobacter properus]MBF9140880.1 hypothetical protein [Hymenobacter properus]MBR7719689.1 hypothetical protein [Microvirga sp. SRT04]